MCETEPRKKPTSTLCHTRACKSIDRSKHTHPQITQPARPRCCWGWIHARPAVDSGRDGGSGPFERVRSPPPRSNRPGSAVCVLESQIATNPQNHAKPTHHTGTGWMQQRIGMDQPVGEAPAPLAPPLEISETETEPQQQHQGASCACVRK
jgi:hypothetical protein